MGKKEKKPKKVEYAPVKATMYAIMYFVIYIIVPYISTTSIEAILPWINFDLLPLPFIFIAGTGIIVMGFIAVYLEPVQPAPSAVFNIGKYGFIIWQTLILYALLRNITIDVAGFPFIDPSAQFSLVISVQVWIPYLYGTLVIAGQGLNIGRFLFQVFFGTRFAEIDHFMVSKKNREIVYFKNDLLAKIEIDELEPDEKELKEEKKLQKQREKELKKQEKERKKLERIEKRKGKISE